MATLYFYTESREETTKIFRLTVFFRADGSSFWQCFAISAIRSIIFFRSGQFCVGLHKSMDHMRQIRLAIKSLIYELKTASMQKNGMKTAV